MSERAEPPSDEPTAGDHECLEVVASRIVDLTGVTLAYLCASGADLLMDMDDDLLEELQAPPALMEGGYYEGGHYSPEPSWRLRGGTAPGEADNSGEDDGWDDDNDWDDDGEWGDEEADDDAGQSGAPA